MCFELNGRKDTKNAITCTHENRLSNRAKSQTTDQVFLYFCALFLYKTLNNK